MLRDVCSGLALAAMTGALYALGMYFGPLSWNLGDDAFDLLMVVGIMLSATAFFVEFLGSSLSRRLREADAEIDKHSRRFEENARSRALQLNAYALHDRRRFGRLRSGKRHSLSGEACASPGASDRAMTRLGLTLG